MPVDLAIAYDSPVGSESKFRFMVNGGWAYEFNDNGSDGLITWGGLVNGVVNTAAIRDRKPGRTTWNVGAGVQFSHRRFDFAAKYDYYSRQEFDAHRLVVSAGIRF